MIEKSLLRRQLLQKRTSLAVEQKAQIERQIAAHILRSSLYQNAGTVLCYAAYGSEIGIWQVVRQAIEDGKTVGFPRCDDKDGHMRFYQVGASEELIPGMYGILEPKASCVQIKELGEAALCLVPGIAFDVFGYRIGYGKGYYDRFLPQFCGVTLGICPAFLLQKQQIWEYDRYDVRMQHIVTEQGCIRIDGT